MKTAALALIAAAAIALPAAAQGPEDAVTFDFDGQPRLEEKDKGADEFSSAPVIARVLTVADVGPHAKPPTPPSITP